MSGKCKSCGSIDLNLNEGDSTFSCNNCGVEVNLELFISKKTNMWEYRSVDKKEYDRLFE